MPAFLLNRVLINAIHERRLASAEAARCLVAHGRGRHQHLIDDVHNPVARLQRRALAGGGNGAPGDCLLHLNVFTASIRHLFPCNCAPDRGQIQTCCHTARRLLR